VHQPAGSGNATSRAVKKETPKKGYLLYLIGILVLTAALYFPSLHNEFTNFDDHLYVTENPLLTEKTTTASDIIKTPVAGNYHPVTMFSLAFNYNLSELDPHSYHVVSLFFHLLNTFLVFYFVWMLFKDRPEIGLIAALLFGIHPLHVESVAWVSSRKDVVYVFFFMLGLISYLLYQADKKKIYFASAIVLMILSCASKPSAVVFPLLLVIIDYLQNRKISMKTLLEKVPYFVVSVIFGMLTIKAQSQAEAITDFEKYTIIQRMLFACYGLMMYLVKMIVPTGLSAMHPYPKTAVGLSAVYLISPVVVLGLVAAAFASIRRTRVVTFGLLFYLISLVLVLQFMSVGRAIIAERYTYLAYLGPFILLGYGYSLILRDKTKRFSAYKRPALAALLIYFGIMAYVSFNRTKVWKDTDTMWSDVIEKYPNDWFAYKGRANWHIKNNEVPLAFSDYNRIIALKPDWAEAYDQRGGIYFSKQKFDSALIDYKKAIALNPKHFKSYSNIGSAYGRSGDSANAFLNFRKSKELNPNYTPTYLSSGILNTFYKNGTAARADFKRYFELEKEKSSPEAYYWNGVNEQNQKQFAAAIASFNKAIEVNPKSGNYFLSRSQVYFAIGQSQNAISDALKAKELGEQVNEDYINSLK
jgi:tetratricopeptide (TPR) repeat protein